MRILVVDDDSTVAEIVQEYLRQAGFEVAHAPDGVTALALNSQFCPDLVILDLLLPGLPGLEVCGRLRETRPELPVIMLTAFGAESDRVLGLETGADDYLTKPFSPRELVLRVQSVLRRSGAASSSSACTARRLITGGVAIDVPARTATLDGLPLLLTVREFDLLMYFMSHPNRAFSRAQLMQDVWGWEFGDTSTVTVHVRRLREKVERDPSNPALLVTVWGIGYRWAGATDGDGPTAISGAM